MRGLEILDLLVVLEILDILVFLDLLGKSWGRVGSKCYQSAVGVLPKCGWGAVGLGGGKNVETFRKNMLWFGIFLNVFLYLCIINNRVALTIKCNIS